MKLIYTVGSIFPTKKYGDVEIVERVENKKVLIRFHNTSFIKKVSLDAVIKGNVRDDSVTTRIAGCGIDDTTYPKYENVGGKLIWLCEAYRDWYDLIQRTCNINYKRKHTAYVDCTICEEWKYFSSFKNWVDNQPNKDWKNCQLDKDLLFRGNNQYSPNTCVYISHKVNCFITIRKSSAYIGTSLHRDGISYIASCRDPSNNKIRGYIGVFPTQLEAHKAWQAKKHEYALRLAEEQEDPRVAKVLQERYAPDKDWTNK